MSDDQLSGFVKLYHSSGVQVSLPVPMFQTITPDIARSMFSSVDAYIQTGWLPDVNGLEQGETLEKVSHLCRREKRNDDGTTSQLVDVYTGGNFRTVCVYHDDQDDLETFKAAFGYPVTDIPLYDGDVPIERGKNPDKDKKYIRIVSGISVVWKPNPKYEGDNDKKHPKRIFVRWDRKSSAPQAAQGGEVQQPTPAQPANGNGHLPAPAAAAPAAAPAPAGSHRTPNAVLEFINKNASQYSGKPISDGKRGVIAPVLEMCFAAGDAKAKRHELQKFLTGHASIREIPDNFLIALYLWLSPSKDSGGAWIPSSQAAAEANAILVELDKAGGLQPELTGAQADPNDYKPPF
jgi:hypothetical protein